MAVRNGAGGLEERDRGGDVEMDLVEPVDPGGANAGSRAVDDRVGLKGVDGAGETGEIGHVEKLEIDVGKIREECLVHATHQDQKTCAWMRCS